MNLKTTERLIKLLASGQTTYATIRLDMPELSNDDLRRMLFPSSNTVNKLIAFSHDISEEEFRRNRFDQNELIVLTEKGKDLLYQLQKEQRQSLLTYVSIALSAIAAVTGIIALFR